MPGFRAGRKSGPIWIVEMTVLERVERQMRPSGQGLCLQVIAWCSKMQFMPGFASQTQAFLEDAFADAATASDLAHAQM